MTTPYYIITQFTVHRTKYFEKTFKKGVDMYGIRWYHTENKGTRYTVQRGRNRIEKRNLGNPEYKNRKNLPEQVNRMQEK